MAKINSVKNTIKRIDESLLEVQNPYGVPTTIIANEEVPIETEGVEELLNVLSLQDTLDKLNGIGFTDNAKIAQVVVTPDFHKGSGIPIGTVIDAMGFVIPKAVGKDICCGMRFIVTDVTEIELRKVLDQIEPKLRSIFFEGQRNIPMSPKQRKALLHHGLKGVHDFHETNKGTGLWNYYDEDQELENLRRTHLGGSLAVSSNPPTLLDDFIMGSGLRDGRDAQIGSVGGGNHFGEIQTIDEILDGTTAFHWGIKPGMVAIMIHSGSVGLGHAVGGDFMKIAKQIYPKDLPHPNHGFYVIPTSQEKYLSEYLDAMNMAANFAFGNRLCLGLMAIRALTEVLGRKVNHKLIYDAPHNLIWQGGNRFIHRKGACPALGMNHLAQDDPYAYFGIPVIIPGSMGASSYLLAGLGNDSLLSSACHGAGRNMSRNASRAISREKYEETMESIRVITPIDPKSTQVSLRKDILEAYHSRVMEEAPYSYKLITPVIDSIESAGVARRVARLWPIMTVKG